MTDTIKAFPLKKNSPSILIYHIGQLGDTLVTLPAIQNIVYKHPESNIILLTDQHINKSNLSSSWDVLSPLNLINHVIFYNIQEQSIRNITKTFKILRKYQFHHTYNLVQRFKKTSSYRDYFFLRLLIRTKRYYSLTPLNYSLKKKSLPKLEPKWLILLKLTGESYLKNDFQLSIPQELITKIRKIYPKKHESNIIIMAPGSKMHAKRWPESRFTELGKRLIKTLPSIQIVVVGGKEDFLLGEQLCTRWGNRGYNLAGKLSILESAAIIKQSLLHIGNDTGSMHLAAMTGTPCIAIFSARDYPGLWEPYGKNHTIFRKDLECSGCMLYDCIEHQKRCLTLISVDEIYNAAILQLKLRNKH